MNSSLTPSVEMAVESASHPSNLNSEKLSVPQNTIVVCRLLAATMCLLVRGRRLQKEKRKFCEHLLTSVYSPERSSQDPIAKVDAHALLFFAFLTEPSDAINQLVQERLLMELEIAASAAFPDLHCTDRLTYASDPGPKKMVDEECCVERRSILLGAAVGLLASKIGESGKTTKACASAFRYKPSFHSLESQLQAYGLRDTDPHWSIGT